ncbi:MAG TPA: phosphate signaling complex protein PhoU [Verrucomicrobiae bacterium]|nr:phosphate signaling complex protein PhoU [Verrucomicrobiae bacterium]
MNQRSHLEESLQRDIDAIRAKVTEMAGLSERALKASLESLTEGNRQLAYSIILRDRYIDELETELDRLCLQFLVRQQPVAGHLRLVFATILINRELERIGDYAESIARQVLLLGTLEARPNYGKIIELGNLSVHMLQDAVRSFLQQDGDLAARTIPIEERANSMRTAINAELKELGDSGKLPLAAVEPLMTIARRLERVTDQAKNLCEEVLYMCTGEFAKHKGTGEFRILFFDAENKCLSQMAEAIAKSLRLQGFVFSSAGITPQPVDARLVDFMATKGIDISAQSAKSIEQVQPWEQYQVIVALGTQAQETLPPRPFKPVIFAWSITDPSGARGEPEVVRAAFESAYQSLESQIRELMAAVLLEPQQPEFKL